jgi:hypothetical protein
VFGERHLRHVLRSYAHYYNGARTHRCSLTIGAVAGLRASFMCHDFGG